MTWTTTEKSNWLEHLLVVECSCGKVAILKLGDGNCRCLKNEWVYVGGKDYGWTCGEPGHFELDTKPLYRTFTDAMMAQAAAGTLTEEQVLDWPS